MRFRSIYMLPSALSSGHHLHFVISVVSQFGNVNDLVTRKIFSNISSHQIPISPEHTLPFRMTSPSQRCWWMLIPCTKSISLKSSTTHYSNPSIYVTSMTLFREPANYCFEWEKSLPTRILSKLLH